MTHAIVLGSLTAATIIGGLIESRNHRQRLAKIPMRIHVNGTRGKSSVARLIAAGLRATITTCCKTTGTLPRMILPDGREYPVFRPAKANVIEQVRIVRTAVESQAQALVIECMALRPRLQWLCEEKLVRATHAVITNCRADHLDVMGPEEEHVAWALAGMIPIGQKLFTAERRHLGILQQACDDRDCELIPITLEEVQAITTADLDPFPYLEHAENVALALKICADLGVDRETALKGMWAAIPDPGAMTAHHMDFFGRKINFVNGFAANDPESTERIWNMALERYPHVQKRIAIFNCRADRADRSRQLAQAINEWQPADFYLLTGTGTWLFARFAVKAGIDPMKLIYAENQGADQIFETCIANAGDSALIMGMANIGGPGLDIVRYFSNRSKFEAFK
ncbi:MAG: poly-gamma-glutamate synthase PgsB/CapB [Akkermansiaceae bacterium]|jgi:poly-gamma-glutamate synthase PgsB/CapB